LGSDTDADTDARIDTDADTDARIDTDSDTDARIDTDADTDARIDTDYDTDARIGEEMAEKKQPPAAVPVKADTETEGHSPRVLGGDAEMETNTGGTTPVKWTQVPRIPQEHERPNKWPVGKWGYRK
jgi:hypothetical protein